MSGVTNAFQNGESDAGELRDIYNIKAKQLGFRDLSSLLRGKKLSQEAKNLKSMWELDGILTISATIEAMDSATETTYSF